MHPQMQEHDKTDTVLMHRQLKRIPLYFLNKPTYLL